MKSINSSIITRFPEYRNLDVNLAFAPVEISKVERFEQNELVKQIFAPDPFTGFPRSDLHIIYSKDADPVVSQFIRDNLLSSIPSGVSADNPDDAINSVRSRNESFVEYANRLKQIAEESLQKLND